ncbi:MAG: hypothetical protein ACT4PL_08630 [Phycisphaerales bacterium]
MPRINPTLTDTGIPSTYGPTPPGGYDPATVARINRGGGPEINWNSVGTRIDTVLRIGLSDRPQGRVSDFAEGSPMNRAAKFADAALALLGNFARDMRGVLDDVRLTPIGKQDRSVEVGTKFLKQLDDLANKDWFLPALRKANERARERVQDTIKLPAADDLASLLREREYRDLLRTMDATSRGAAWQQIVTERDVVGIAAVVNAPPFARLLPERSVEEGLKAVADATDPEAASAREEAAIALRHVELMHNDMKTMIANAGGIDLSPRREGLSAANREGVVA